MAGPFDTLIVERIGGVKAFDKDFVEIFSSALAKKREGS
jgi:hypothetical protein